MSDACHTRGRRGEDLAAEHFKRLGFEVLARNHRTRFGKSSLFRYSVRVRSLPPATTRAVEPRLGANVGKSPRAPSPARGRSPPMRLDAYIRVSSVRGRKGETFISPDVQGERIVAW